MKQTDRLLDYLKRNATINPLQSWSELGIYRLASRICDLKREGWEIRKEMVSVKNRYGESVLFARYSLVTDDQYEMFRDYEGECNTKEELQCHQD